MTRLMLWAGLRSPDPLVPCQCRPLWRRVIRHAGKRNHYGAILARYESVLATRRQGAAHLKRVVDEVNRV